MFNILEYRLGYTWYNYEKMCNERHRPKSLKKKNASKCFVHLGPEHRWNFVKFESIWKIDKIIQEKLSAKVKLSA
jgi:hypothetical protein